MKAYEALYRKYRPQGFEEVAGQDQVLSYLKKVVSEKKPAHAYLFSGGRGTGKTSLARIFAKSLGVNSEDLYELDAASNRGIDEVRELRDSVHTLPFSSPYKVYILDEAHMLTKDASNALLKTLEEPPAHVIFILATTEKHKLLGTIVSRCQALSFELPEDETLSKHLVSVSEKEGRVLTSEAAMLIAKEAKGSFRDALGLLEKVLHLAKEKTVSDEEVRSLLGFSDKERLESLVLALFGADEKALMEAFLHLKEKNGSAEMVFDEVLDLLRSLLLFRIGETALLGGKKELEVLSQKLAKPVQSKHLLFLLEKSSLLKQNSERAWIVLEMLFLELRGSHS